MQSIRVEDYGTIGDGTTDDTVAIQAALNAAATIPGAIVFFHERNFYCVDGLTIPAGVNIVGASLCGKG